MHNSCSSMMRLPGRTTFLVAGVSMIAVLGCASTPGGSGEGSINLLTPKIQEGIRRVVPSVVGVGSYFDYRMEQFHHELSNGSFIRDVSSRTGYRLTGGLSAVSIFDTTMRVHGTGVILYNDDRRAVVLTSEHILASDDTLRIFYRDSLGAATDVLYSQAIRTKSTFYVNDQHDRAIRAEILHTDAQADLGLLLVESLSPTGVPFPFDIAYDAKLDWGDIGFVFGYPHQSKQVALGIISPSPLPGDFVIDAATRFGYSGGPIIIVRENNKLELGGIMRAIPASELDYVAPPPSVPPGEFLDTENIRQLRAAQTYLVESGTAYGVGAETIGEFLKSSLLRLENRGISLPRRFLPQ
jgi:S1-C subfamily serine protease